MSKSYSKNDLIFFYSNSQFPKDLVFPNVLIHKELLFSSETQQPENNVQNKKNKLSNSFLIEDELEAKKGGFRKGKFPLQPNITKGNNFNNQTNWKKGEFEDPGFFDNFKGKSDEKQVNIFRRNMELFEVRENSLSISDNNYVDFMQVENKIFNKIDLNKDFSQKEITTTADELFGSDNVYNLKYQKSEGKIIKKLKIFFLLKRFKSPKIIIG